MTYLCFGAGVWRPKYSKITWADLKRIEIIKRFLSYVSVCTIKCRDENKVVFFFNRTCKKIGVYFFTFIIMSIGFRPLKTKLVDLCLGSWTKQWSNLQWKEAASGIFPLCEGTRSPSRWLTWRHNNFSDRGHSMTVRRLITSISRIFTKEIVVLRCRWDKRMICLISIMFFCQLCVHCILMLEFWRNKSLSLKGMVPVHY